MSKATLGFTAFTSLALAALLSGCPAQEAAAPAEVNCAEQCPCECKCDEAVATEKTQKNDAGEDVAVDQIPQDKTGEPYPVVLVGNIKVTEGQLDEKEARRRVSNQRIALRACYEPVLKANKEVRGEMDVQFTVSPGTGKIIASIVRQSTIDDKDLQKCVTDKLKELRFDPHKGKEAIVRFSLVMVGVNF
jgi:hypothetical protein